MQPQKFVMQKVGGVKLIASRDHRPFSLALDAAGVAAGGQVNTSLRAISMGRYSVFWGFTGCIWRTITRAVSPWVQSVEKFSRFILMTSAALAFEMRCVSLYKSTKIKCSCWVMGVPTGLYFDFVGWFLGGFVWSHACSGNVYI
jgi:hypothetical protein